MQDLKPDVLGEAAMGLIHDLINCRPIEPEILAKQAGWTQAKLKEWLKLPSPSNLNDWFTILVILIGEQEDGEVTMMPSTEGQADSRRYSLPSTGDVGEALAMGSSAEILLECIGRAAVIIADYREQARDRYLKVAKALAGRLGQARPSI